MLASAYTYTCTRACERTHVYERVAAGPFDKVEILIQTFTQLLPLPAIISNVARYSNFNNEDLYRTRPLLVELDLGHQLQIYIRRYNELLSYH